MNWLNPTNCQSCEQRKEALQKMLSDHKFWIGVVVGVVGTYAWHMYKAKG